MATTDPNSPAGPGANRSREDPSAAASTRTWAITAGILVVGWGIAIVVYATATPVVTDDMVDDWEHSRRYLLQLERIGGKAAVLGSEMNAWIAGLWQGQALAYTIAFLTAAVALGYFFLARRSRARGLDEEPGAQK